MRSSKIIMLIDDDKDDRFFFKTALQEIDASIIYIEAKDAIEGLEKLSNATELPDYIFLDVNMPKMNGLDCLIKLKADERLKDITVIMYSTSNQAQNVAMSIGAAGWLVKPADYDELAPSIKKAMEEVDAAA